MKKAITLLMMLLLVALPLALAEEQAESGENQEINQETQKEVSTMNTPPGAAVRLLQLEKAITRNILKGKEVIAVVKADGNDTSELEAIIAEMELLKTEVQKADPASDNATKIFVDLKADAIELSKEFRDKARVFFTSQKALELRERLKSINREDIKELGEKIKEKIKEYNAEQLKAAFEILKISNEQLIQKFQNGEINYSEIRDAIKNALKNMTPEERHDATQELKEEGIKKSVFIRAAVEKIKLNQVVRKEARLTLRLNQSRRMNDSEKREKVAEWINKRINQLNRMENKTLERLQNMSKLRNRNQQGVAVNNETGEEE